MTLSEAAHQQGRYQARRGIATRLLKLEKGQSLVVWVELVDFPLLLTRQVYKDKDREQGHLYLVTNDLTSAPEQADSVCIQTQYARLWKVEEFHKSMTGYGHSLPHTVRTQSNLFLSMLAYAKLKALRLNTSRNHVALKRLLAYNALRLALSDLNRPKS